MGTSIDVIVIPHDTLDRIFRRLKLDLSDLASLRGLPGPRARLDALRPGEALRLTARDGGLVGFERRLNTSETLKVTRDASGFQADVLKNPLESRVITIRGVIDRSLFEAVNLAGVTIRSHSRSPRFSAGISTLPWLSGPGIHSS